MSRVAPDRLWYGYEAVVSFAWALVFTVSAVYFVVDVGMNPLELVLVGTVMELAVFLFEVPTGIVADVYGRRLSVVIGLVVMGAAFVLAGAVVGVAVVLAGWALWGVGWTFVSGAFDAWLADEVGQERLGAVYQRGAQVSRVAQLAGIGGAVALALVDLRLPIVAGGALTAAFGIAAALLMPETGFRPAPRGERGVLAHMVETGRAGGRLVRRRPALLAILVAAAFAGMWSESFDRLWQAHFIESVGLPAVLGLDPVVWFGLFGAGALLLSIGVAEPVRRSLEGADVAALARTLFAVQLVIAAAALTFALAGSLWLALAASWAIVVARNVAAPLFTTWLQGQVEQSSVRATVLSITNQADAVGQWTGGPAIGALGTVFSIRAALAGATVALLPAAWVFRRFARGPAAEPAPVPETT